MPVRGETVPELVTPALPPPLVCTPAPPSLPRTAIEWVVAVDSGRRLPEFFNRTVPSSATWRAVVTWAGVVTTAPVEPVGALSNKPNLNICVRTLLTIVSSVAWVTVPAVTAWDRAVPKDELPGISIVIPAFADATVEGVAPHAEATNPANASPRCRAV